MTDAKLLELAARAAIRAGMPIIQDRDGPQILYRTEANGNECYRIWNPIKDDGDAFRLAVKLRLYISHQNIGRVFVDITDNEGRYYPTAARWKGASEEYGADPNAATRRAIVEAAAEIGRAMG